MIHQLMYSSAAAEEVDDAALGDILAVARQRNAVAGITGSLIFADRLFVQVLEGPREALMALLSRIADDPRHRDVKVFYEAERTAPAFAEWRMAYISPNPGEVAHWSGHEGTATLAELRGIITGRPDSVPDVLAKIVEALAEL